MVKEYLNRAIINGNKSTILLPLRWLIGLSFSSTLISVGIKAPDWITVLFALTSGLSILLFFFSYLYSLIKQPENLRSEKYTIQKMAIERGFFGDNIVGEVKIQTKKDIELIEDVPLSNESSGQ